MKKLLVVIVIMLLSISTVFAFMARQAKVDMAIEQLTETLYLDTTLLPDKFDRATLVRLYNFVETHVIPDDARTPFPGYYGQLPVIVRYTPYEIGGLYPETTEGFAGWCDLVELDCKDDENCTANRIEEEVNANAFLALVALPEPESTDYAVQVWGITAHELAHTMGAIDGSGCPLYEGDKLVAPIEPESDTYYWFGISGLFESGWKGIVWNAWQNTCNDPICEALRKDVFLLDLPTS